MTSKVSNVLSTYIDSSARLSWLARLMVVSLLVMPVQLLAAAGVIRTVAGNGNTVYIPSVYDGGSAVHAGMHMPSGVAVDSHGTFYVADTSNNAVRQVTAGGIISTAPTNYAGHSLNNPYAVAVDAAGDLYISDTFNNRVVMVTAVVTSGGVTTGGVTSVVAGGGVTGIDSGYGGDGGPATAAGALLTTPFGLALDSDDNLYIADAGNNVIRKVTPVVAQPGGGTTGGIITTVAGNNTAGFSGDTQAATSAQLSIPYDVALFGSTLYIADYRNNRVRQVTGGIITTFAGDGTGTLFPKALAVDASGNLYVADDQNNVVRKIAAGTGGSVSTVIGTGTGGFSGDGFDPTTAELNSPQGLAVDANGSLFVADAGNNRIRRVTYGPVPAAVTVTTSPSSPTTAQVVTATVTVNGGLASPQPPSPAGSVTLSAGTYTSATPVTLDMDGNATITVPAFSLDAGSDVLSVTYTSTDTINYKDSTGTTPVTVMAVTPTVTVTPASLSVSQNESLAITVTVSGGTGSPPTVSGLVTLTSGDGSYTSSATALSAGSVTITIPANSLPLNSNTITATYAPDTAAAAFYATATGANPSPIVVTSSSLATPPVTVTSSASAITQAQPLTVTVMVAAVGSNPVPTGTVLLTSSSGTLSLPAIALSGGIANFIVPPGKLLPGMNSLTATFTPDTTSAAIYNSAPGSVIVSVVVAKATVTLSTPSNNVTTVQNLVVKAAVSGGAAGAPTPTGSVVLTLSGTNGYQTPATTLDNTGTAMITVAAGQLKPNTYAVSAAYTPDAASSSIYTTASGTLPAPVVVTKPTPTVTVMPSASSITTAETLTVAVAVSGGSGNLTPDGSVVLTAGGYTSSPVYLQSGSASVFLPYGVLAAGTDTLTVTFTSGSGDYNGASGTAQVAVTSVLQSTPGLRIEASPPATLGVTYSYFTTAQDIPVMIALTGPPGFPQPTGTVSISGGGYNSPMPTVLDSTGSATVTLPAGSFLPGSYVLTVSYSPDLGGSALYNPATGTVSVLVAAAAGFTVSSDGSVSVASGTTNTAVITVTPINNSAGSFSGQINLSCTVTTSLTNYSGLPTCQLGGSSTTTSVTVSGTPVTTTLTVKTVAAAKQSAMLLGNLFSGGGITLAGLLLLGIPARRYRRWSLLGCLFVIFMGLGACSSSSTSSSPSTPNIGTTAGTYLVTVTGTDAATGQLSSTSSLNVTVQ